MTDADGPRALRRLPAVGRWLDDPALVRLIEHHGRPAVTDAARLAIEEARRSILSGQGTLDPKALLSALSRHLEDRAAPSLTRVLNGTGVVLHTNLGRAPLSAAAREAVGRAAEGYSNLEMDLESGLRGRRDGHVSSLAAELVGAEDAFVVNNCAGATMLMLGALCRGGEVIVSRGELVEIGGGFRVPEIMEESGAQLVEVGTTNKVYPRDYERAGTAATRAVLSVHRSNFAVVGFTHTPSPQEMVNAARALGVPLLVDLGSGLMAEDHALGRAAATVGAEPRPRDWIRAGADLVAVSGDKLMGGPQAGLLAGRAELVERCRRHPLARALRLDKLGLAALEATLRDYRDGRAAEVPAVRAMAEPLENVAERAERLRAALLPFFTTADAPKVVPSVSRPGGGSLPTVELPSRAVVFGPPGGEAERLAARLRSVRPAIVGRMLDDRVALDARTLDDAEIPMVATGIERALSTATQPPLPSDAPGAFESAAQGGDLG
ncbi:MAG: L-seryl-tRNA(Sec) selenium transferase [Myxococcota bacterium]